MDEKLEIEKEMDRKNVRRVLIFKIEDNGLPFKNISKENHLLYSLFKMCNKDSMVHINSEVLNALLLEVRISKDTFYKIMKNFNSDNIVKKRSRGFYWLNNTRIKYDIDKYFKY